MLNFMAMYWPQGWKKDTIKFGRPICNLWGPMFQHLLVTWGQFATQKCSKLGPSFFGPDSECKADLSVAIFFAR